MARLLDLQSVVTVVESDGAVVGSAVVTVVESDGAVVGSS